ncbi:tail fiber domain-containing protein [Gilvibacter sediminis]|uniref:tail fiber domain-containing protein n=1 Tax=Gilvibacter sediminis TaxID=379071 RepID=UPI00234FB90B|nr:tail fiber domain-containing protein [Gilvibacter sediminis]MDC7996455.1 tail fiber domain-containing protein [Gilvibacter sediminis]
MKRILPLVILAFAALDLHAQVGINNISPNASLDITASNQATPANTDGLLIPRIDAFPSSDPATAQHGMLVYLTTTDGGNPPGFYFWNNGTTSWDSISGSGAEQINELTDGIADGSSLYLGASSGLNDDGANSNVGVGLFSLSNNTSGNSNTAVGSLAMINNTTGFGNTAVGRQSLPTNTTGNDNTMIGFQAGLSSTTGSQNVGVGSFSLDANTTGINNTAIGYASLSQNNTGTLNTAIGSTALAGNTDGTQNVGIGSGALTANISGDFNVALGNNALSGLVNSDYNIAIGRSAMSASSTSTDADHNVAIGYRGLANLTEGEQNVGIGDYVMESVTSGSFNVATGASALRDITTGQRNMVYGYSAGRNITSGSNNTFMGNQAGTANETGTFNTMLGSFAGLTNLGSNNVFLGGSAGGSNVSGSGNVFIGTAAGSNETGSNLLYIDNSGIVDPLIWGDFISNDLRINGQLQVGNPSGTGYELPNTDGTAGQVLRTNGSGSISWADFSASTTNGLSTISSSVGLGGTLAQNTTINQGFYDLEFNLNSSGSFIISDSGIDHFEMDGLGNMYVGGETYWRNTTTSGTNVARMYSSSGSGTLDLYGTGSISTRISSNSSSFFNGGNVGIGTFSPNELLDVDGADANGFIAEIYNRSSSTNADGLAIRINNTSVSTSNFFIAFYSSGSTIRGRVTGNGLGGLLYSTTSDARLKTNFKNVEGALAMISRMNPQWYEYKNHLGHQEMGFLAQELQKVYPNAVAGSPDSDPETEPMMVDYAKITPILTAGIKELNEKVQALEAENAQLKAQLNQYAALEARIAALEGSDNSNKTDAPAVSEE